MITIITNKDLLPDLIPDDAASWSEIQQFSLTYDGYKERGEAECVRIANNRIHATLDDLRTCLFFEQRRWRHFGEEPDGEAMNYFRILVSKIRQYVDVK